jgi:protein-S-isoprenylcysteine O-methyltransferase Ste14
MATLRLTIGCLWLAFWVYWLIAARGAKAGTRRRGLPPGVRVLVVLFVLFRVVHVNGLETHDLAVAIVGAVLFLVGLGLAVWARIFIGRNWGMPMTQKAEPELVTSGPYRFVRNPIYTGILLGMLGTALAVSLYWLIALAVMGSYFIYSATVEERRLSETFPATYPAYRARTKMLIPFLL